MKKIFIILSFVAVLAVGCKSKGTKINANGSVEVSSQNDANKIIDYTNDLIDVMKKYNEASEKAVTSYESLEDSWSGKSRFFGSIANDMNFLWTEKTKAAKAFGTPPAALGDALTFFNDSVGKYKGLFKKFQENDSVLKIYLKAEDFKDDKYVKGKDLLNNQYEIYPQLANLRSSIGAKIDLVADAAEEVSLKDSPIKDAYKAAKGDLATMRKLTNMIAGKEKYSDADLTAIDAAYAGFTLSIEKNKAANQTSLAKENKASQYNSFYENLIEENAKLKSVIRNIKTSKKLSENDYDAVDRSYSNVVSAYNSWVN
jgi:Protein of unknown function (DUF3829)